MTIIRRQDYMDHKVSYEEYYGQFVTGGIKQAVVRSIGMDRIMQSTDPHFNDIPLQLWDNLVPLLGFGTPTRLKEAGEWLSLGTGVCILKEAARQLKAGL